MSDSRTRGVCGPPLGQTPHSLGPAICCPRGRPSNHGHSSHPALTIHGVACVAWNSFGPACMSHIKVDDEHEEACALVVSGKQTEASSASLRTQNPSRKGPGTSCPEISSQTAHHRSIGPPSSHHLTDLGHIAKVQSGYTPPPLHSALSPESVETYCRERQTQAAITLVHLL